MDNDNTGVSEGNNNLVENPGDIKSPAATFAAKLVFVAEQDLTTNNYPDEDLTTEMVVQKFDHCLFHTVMSTSSAGHDGALAAQINEIADHVFATGRVWQSRDLVFVAAVQDFAKVDGWLSKKTAAYIRCNRCGTKRTYANMEHRQYFIKIYYGALVISISK